MISIIFFLSTALLTQGLPSSSFRNVSDGDARIIGGSDAKISEFPHQVSIRFSSNNQHFCGGSIMDSRNILTAAHCVDGMKSNQMKIVVGTGKVNSGGTVYMVGSFTKHESYNSKTFVHDIALVYTTKDIKMTDTVKTISLYDAEVAAGAELILSGFGYNKYPSRAVAPNVLQKMTTYAISMADCKKAHKNYGPWGAALSDYQMCTLAKKNTNTGACKGDSGGPLIIMKNEQFSSVQLQQVGIVSWGHPCAKPNNPDVFTRILAYIIWIKENLKK